MNMLHLTGNIGKDAIVRTAGANNTPVANFSVAMKSGYGQNEQTTWVNCAIWGVRADKLAPYLQKGIKVAVAGEVSLREWTNQSGETKTNLECKVSEVTLLSSKSDAAPAQQSAPAQSGTPDLSNDDIDDDIPF